MHNNENLKKLKPKPKKIPHPPPLFLYFHSSSIRSCPNYLFHFSLLRTSVFLFKSCKLHNKVHSTSYKKILYLLIRTSQVVSKVRYFWQTDQKLKISHHCWTHCAFQTELGDFKMDVFCKYLPWGLAFIILECALKLPRNKTINRHSKL